MVYIQKYGATLLVGAWQREKQQNELVECKAFVDTVRMKSADLKKTLNYFKMIPILVESFRKRDKNIGNFLVSSAFKTSEQPGTFKCARA